MSRYEFQIVCTPVILSHVYWTQCATTPGCSNLKYSAVVARSGASQSWNLQLCLINNHERGSSAIAEVLLRTISNFELGIVRLILKILILLSFDTVHNLKSIEFQHSHHHRLSLLLILFQHPFSATCPPYPRSLRIESRPVQFHFIDMTMLLFCLFCCRSWLTVQH